MRSDIAIYESLSMIIWHAVYARVLQGKGAEEVRRLHLLGREKGEKKALSEKRAAFSPTPRHSSAAEEITHDLPTNYQDAIINSGLRTDYNNAAPR